MTKKAQEIFASATTPFPGPSDWSIDVIDGKSVTFTQVGLTGGDEIPIEEFLDGTWATLTDEDGADVKMTATIKKVRILATGRYRPQKGTTGAATAIFVAQ